MTQEKKASDQKTTKATKKPATKKAAPKKTTKAAAKKPVTKKAAAKKVTTKKVSPKKAAPKKAAPKKAVKEQVAPETVVPTPKPEANTAKTQSNQFADLIQTIKDTVLFPVHAEGWPFIIGFALLTLVLGLIDETLLIIGLILTGWCVFFFRNPVRMTPTDENLVISPAFGKICDIAYDVAPPVELDQMEHDDADYTRVSIFLSVFDVHVNRIPFSGTITQKVYRPGKFLNAALDKASIDNEMCALAMTFEHDGKTKELAFCQIAGWVARRIVTNIEEGQTVKAGQELGIIRFGSRMDVYLPKGVAPQVIIGQRVVEGETVLADFASAKAPRAGESRGQN